jgi:thiamine biosynthesis lipoprotein
MRLRKDILVGAVMLALAVAVVVTGLLLERAGGGRLRRALVVREMPGRPGWYETGMEVMDTDMRLEVAAPGVGPARKMLAAAVRSVQEVESRMSTFRPDSEISRVNLLAAQQPVKVSEWTMAVMRKSVEGSRLTGGAFDVAYAPLRTLWRRAERDGRVPSADDISKTLESVGYTRLVLGQDTVRFTVPGMEVDLGGVAKGYAVDRAADALRQAGAREALVDIGGNLRLIGEPSPGERWRVLVRPPPGAEERIVLALPACSVATSGDYARYFKIGNQHFSHIIDPRTGRPIANMSSVTIVAPEAVDTDVLSTGVSVMGADAGLALVEKLPGVDCMVMVRQPDGTIGKRMSSGFARWVESATPEREPQGAAPGSGLRGTDGAQRAAPASVQREAR